VASASGERMIHAALWLILGMFALGGIGLWSASVRVTPAERRSRLIKFLSYVFIVYTVVFAAMLSWLLLAAVMLLILAAGVAELRRALQASRPHIGIFGPGIWTAYFFLGAALLLFARYATAEEAVLVYVVVITMDGFSQVSGQLFGRHQIASRVSPGKTLEGLAGGVLMATAASIFLGGLAGLTLAQSAFLGGGVIGAAYAGDLAASWVKRRSGLKDFGTLLPGHGGILDRFDSLLLAGPMSILLLRLLNLRSWPV
jgi:phosphatidate cytidylyltransferase